MSESMPMREQNARRFVAVAATLGALGIAANLGSDEGVLPKLVAALGVVALVWSIHRFGRLGPDAALVFEAKAPVAKKKKKKKRAAETPPAEDS